MTPNEWPRRRTEACLSDAQLDSLTHDELDAAEGSEANRHLESCALCRARCSELTAARDAWRARSLPALSTWVTSSTAAAPQEAQEAQAAQARVLPFRRATRWVAGAAAALSVAASLIVVVRTGAPQGDAPALRSKGDLALRVFVEGPQGARELGVGDALHAGDRLRFALSGAGDGLALVVGVDAAGEASVYAPSSGQFAPPGGDGALAGIAQVDDVVGTERLVAVVCTTAPAVSMVLGAARRSSGATWPEGCRAVERLFEKRARP